MNGKLYLNNPIKDENCRYLEMYAKIPVNKL